MLSKIQRHFNFERNEQQDIFLTAFVGSLVLFMFVWRTTSFTLRTGLPQFILMLIASVFGISIFISSTKIIALTRNYTATYVRWTSGLLIGFVISFLSYGFIPVIFPGYIEMERIRRLSHGERYILENKRDIFLILVGGLWVTMISGILFQALYAASGILFFYYLMVSVAIICTFSMIPFANSVGVHLFYVARKKYYFVASGTLLFGIFLLFNSPYALLFAILGALILSPIMLKNPLEG